MKYEYEFEDRMLARYRRECHFGIISGAIAIAAAISATTAAAAGSVALGLEAVGVGAATAGALGTAAVGATIGAGLGAGEAAIMGGDPGMGALGGAISGGVLSGAGGPLGEALGSQFAGDVIAGSAGGALSAAATGGDPLKGAMGGAVSGGISYGLGELGTQAPTPGGPPTPTGGAGGGIPGVESVTVTAPGGVTPVTLAGMNAGGTGQQQQQGTAGKSATTTAAPGTVTAPGVEEVVVTGANTGGVPGAAGLTLSGLTPTSTGASPLTPAAPTGPTNQQLSDQAAQSAQQKTTGLGAATTGGQIGTGTESITVPGTRVSNTPSSAPPITLAGIGAGSSQVAGPAADTEDPEQKDKEKGYFDKLAGKTEDMLSNPYVLLGGGLLAANQMGLFGSGGGSGQLAGGTEQQAKALDQIAQGNVQQGTQIGNMAENAMNKGNQLQSYLTTGGTPPGIQAQLDAARAAQEAQTRQMYGNLGMGQGNTSLGADLGNIQQQYAAASAQVAESLYGLGAEQQQLALSMFQQAMAQTDAGANIYAGLLQQNLAQDKALSDGVQNFVSSLANMARPIQNYVPAAAAGLA